MVKVRSRSWAGEEVSFNSDPRVVDTLFLRENGNSVMSAHERVVKASRAGSGPRFSKAKLEGLVEEATIDAHGETEQAGGLFTMIEENLRVPFSTTLPGVEVTVKRIEVTEGDVA